MKSGLKYHLHDEQRQSCWSSGAQLCSLLASYAHRPCTDICYLPGAPEWVKCCDKRLTTGSLEGKETALFVASAEFGKHLRKLPT